MALFISENGSSFETEFTPFDDSQQEIIRDLIKRYQVSADGINTTEIDNFRQGINITSEKYRFQSTQPKLWAGNVFGYQNLHTLGQPKSWVEHTETAAFEELPKFDPVAYINLGDDYPHPLYFNEGPQQGEEASFEPFTLKFKEENQNEGPVFAHDVRGNLGDGNWGGIINNNADRIEQFIPYDDQPVTSFFLDEGQEYWGEQGAGNESIMVEGYLAFVEKEVVPFKDDIEDKLIVATSASNDLIEALNGTSLIDVTTYTVSGNLLSAPNSFDNSVWQEASPLASVSADTNVGLDGTLTADKITDDDSGAYERLEQSATTTSGTVYTALIYVLKDDNISRFPEFVGTGDFSAFALGLNTKTGNTAFRVNDLSATATTELIKGWWRLRIEFTTNHSSTSFTIFPARGIAITTPDNSTTGSIITWGAHLIEGTLSSLSQEFKLELSPLDINLNNDLRHTYRQKSSAAGYDVYSQYVSNMGTDSITYQGTYRGS